MNQNSIETFLESASLKMPDIIKPSNELRQKREVYHDNTVLTLAPRRPLTIQQFIETIEGNIGMIMMYHHMRSRHTDFGQSLCFFQEPGFGSMFQIDCTTDTWGLIKRVDVRLYSSLETMVANLRDQLRRINSVSGEFAYKIEDSELISHFL